MGLKPHRVETFKLSNDPDFAEKLEAIVGSYSDPPEHAQDQRVFNGEVMGVCMERHRHQEWLKFLRLIEQATLPNQTFHLICDNYATHKHPRVQRWLSKRSRFHVHSTPTSASWLNMVERYFRDLTQNRLKREVFRDLEELIMAVEGYIDLHNQNPKPFIWTAYARDILQKVTRARKPSIKVKACEAHH